MQHLSGGIVLDIPTQEIRMQEISTIEPSSFRRHDVLCFWICLLEKLYTVIFYGIFVFC